MNFFWSNWSDSGAAPEQNQQLARLSNKDAQHSLHTNIPSTIPFAMISDLISSNAYSKKDSSLRPSH